MARAVPGFCHIQLPFLLIFAAGLEQDELIEEGSLCDLTEDPAELCIYASDFNDAIDCPHHRESLLKIYDFMKVRVDGLDHKIHHLIKSDELSILCCEVHNFVFIFCFKKCLPS